MMNSKTRRLLAALALLGVAMNGAAIKVTAPTYKKQSYQVGVGSTQVLDTYLSQEKFSGTGITFLTTTDRHLSEKELLKPFRWHTLIQHQATLSTVDDRSGSRDELLGNYSVYVGRVYEWRLATWNDYAVSVQTGGVLGGNLGFVYNTSNSNNPAQARASLNLMPFVAADCGLKLFKRELHAHYELMLPLAGLAFSPNYGQSYYEIFSLGNYDHNVVPTSFVSAPNFRQQFAIDYKLWKEASLRIGYLGDFQQLRVNNLKSHVYHNSIMIGYVRHLQFYKYHK